MKDSPMFEVISVKFLPNGIEVTYLKRGAVQQATQLIPNVKTLRDPEERTLLELVQSKLASIIIR